jgi:ceramide glucosyltransferase
MKRFAWLAGPAALLLLGGLVAFEGSLRTAHHLVLALLCVSVAATLAGIGYTLLASALMRRFFARPTAEAASYPPVTVVKPLHGDEWDLLSHLSSFCHQDYPGEVQYLFGVHDLADPALKTVDELRRLYPDAHITVVTDTRLYGPNRKISNIVNMLPQAHHDVLVFADSDVSVNPDFLHNVVGELEKPDVGLVTCIYRGNPAPGIWARLSVYAIDNHFVPGVITGFTLGLAHPCLGPSIAMHRATLEKIGGFEQFAHHLAEDHAIGRAVRMAGEKVAIPPFTISHACDEASAAELVQHEPDYPHHRPGRPSWFCADASFRVCLAGRCIIGRGKLVMAARRGRAAVAVLVKAALGSCVAATSRRAVVAADKRYCVLWHFPHELPFDADKLAWLRFQGGRRRPAVSRPGRVTEAG